MSTSITVRRFLDNQDVEYTTVPVAAGEQGTLVSQGGRIPLNSIARAVILKDIRGMVMAVLPSTHRLNLEALNHQLHRRLQPATPEDYRGVFADCVLKLLPALGEAYGFETIIDDSLLDHDFVYLFSGNPGELVRVTGADFQLLHSNAWYGNTFSQISDDPRAKPAAAPAAEPVTSIASMRQRIERLTELPAMPTLAQKIIQLNANPYAHAEDLAKLIERDPSLSAQIVRYAQSPLYGYQGKVISVRQAISRVLGYDMVMNIALGIAATRPFKLPAEGPLGLNAFWRHATYSAALAQALCSAVPRSLRPRPGMAYLAALLHNFGFLLLGHLFPREFAVLHNAVRQEPGTPVLELEQRLLGTTHMEIGAWLMESWNMPQEVIISQREHHNPDYNGVHANYAQVVALADAMLKGHDMGDAASDDIPESILSAVGLQEEQALAVLSRTLEGSDDLESMARLLVA